MVEALYTYQKEPRKQCAQAVLQCVAGCGIKGDRFADGSRRQVSIMALAATELNHGWCGKRFKANIVLSHVDFAQLSAHKILTLGTAVIRISEDSKSCYGASCEAYDEQRPCPVLGNCLYGVVLQSGEIALGDQAIILPDTPHPPESPLR